MTYLTKIPEFFHDDASAQEQLDSLVKSLEVRYVGARVRLIDNRPKVGGREGTITSVGIWDSEPWYGVKVFRLGHRGETTLVLGKIETFHLYEHMVLL